MNLKKFNKIILLIVLFLMIGMISVNASVEKVLNFTVDSETYANSYSDLKEAYGTDDNRLKEHFANWGVKEGRVASPIFDVKYYVAYNGDLQQAYGTDYEKAYNHFVNYGMKEGRRTSPVFDVKYYVAQHGDLQQAYGTDYEKAFNHFINYGMGEGRKTASNFDVQYYLIYNSDLKQAYGTDYKKAFNHYLSYGMAEGRVTVAPKTPEKPIDPEKPEHTHSYVPTFDFAEDNKKCTITLTCSKDASHKVDFVVDTTSEVKVEATCETEGKVVYTATKEFDGVKYTKTKEVTEKVAHDFSKESVKKASTCNAEGIVYHVCSRCGSFEKDANGAVIEFKVPKKDHEWQKDENGKDVIVDVREEATCTDDAYVMKHCKLCGKDISESTASKTGHDYKLQVEAKEYWKNFMPGKTTLTVNLVCANNKAEVVRGLKANVEKVSSRVATCTEDGVDVYTAKLEYIDPEDGQKYEFSFGEKEVTLPKTGHAQAPTDVNLPNGDIERTTICPDCGLNETKIIHTVFTTTDAKRIVKEPTCSEEGIGEWICAHCNQTEEGPIAKTQHSLVEEPAVAANCKEDTDGHIRYWRCTICDEYFKDATATQEISFDETIIPAEHTLRHVVAKDKTCTTDGRIEYWTCNTCKRIFRDADATDECTVADTKIKASHNIEYVPETVATCEESGNKEHYKCTAESCGKLFLDENGKVETTSATVVIAKNAHEYEEHAAIAPICTEDGMKKYYTCKTCSNYFATQNGKVVKPETLIIKALGAPHSLTHVVAKDATCTADGNVEYWECSKCNTKFTAERATQADVISNEDTIIPMGHKFVVVGTKAECEYATIYCSACKDHGTATKPVSAETLIPADVDKTDRKALEIAAKAVFGDDYANHIPSRAHDTFTIERTENGKVYQIIHCNICNKDLSKAEKN